MPGGGVSKLLFENIKKLFLGWCPIKNPRKNWEKTKKVKMKN
jgi:hypothetical protein